MAEQKDTLVEPTAKKGRRARGSLSQEEILDAAKTLVERDGLQQLNMPALAKQLNSGVTSIYWYFRSKDELVTALVDKVAREIYRGLPPVGNLPWDKEFCEYFAAFRTLLEDTPIYREVFAFRSQSLYEQGAIGGTMLKRLEEGMALLVNAGLTPDQASEVFSACSNYTRGFVLLEHGIATERTADGTPTGSLAIKVSAAPEKYPTLSAIHDLDRSVELHDRDFLSGLRLILDGARRIIEANAAS